jgi:hypothetical protein
VSHETIRRGAVQDKKSWAALFVYRLKAVGNSKLLQVTSFWKGFTMEVSMKVLEHQCPPTEPNRCLCWGDLQTRDFFISVYPDTAKTKLGQKRQVMSLARLIAGLMADPVFNDTHDKEYGVWEDGWHERSFRYHLVGPSPDYVSYVRKSRKKNRPGYITDTMIDIRVEYLGPWHDASRQTRRMANLIAETLNNKS